MSSEESFSVVKTLIGTPDIKRMLESNREFVQQLARLVFDQFCTRSLAFPLIKSQDFRLKLEASIINWLMTFFGASLGIPELLSMLILTLMDGARFLAALSIVILETHFVEWSKGSRSAYPEFQRRQDEETLDIFCMKIRRNFENLRSFNQKRYNVSLSDTSLSSRKRRKS